MKFADQIAVDVDKVFLNTDDFAVEVTITRDGVSTVVTAIVGSSQFQVSTDFGITQYETRDFIFNANEANVGQEECRFVPCRKDVFYDGEATYAVASALGSDFYSLDVDRQLLTVHTTKISQ